MKITEARLARLSAELRVPFKTALRTVERLTDVVVEIHTDTGEVGYGEAPPTGAITGDTYLGIIGALSDHIIPKLIGRDVEALEPTLDIIDASCVHNESAKAAASTAVYDLYGQLLNVPVYKMLGGARSQIETDITISVNPPDEMARDALNAVSRGYDCLKTKVGIDVNTDIRRLTAVRQAVGGGVKIRIDANQGWTAKEAVYALDKMQSAGLDIELVEQPVKARDIRGLKYVRDQSVVPVMADESVFSPEDALEILRIGAADYINIKLMKCGGLRNALRIATACEIYGVECMIGCMLEAKISVNAAAHLACAKGIITRVDLDGPVLLKSDPVLGGANFSEKVITMSDAPGFGVFGVESGHLEYL